MVKLICMTVEEQTYNQYIETLQSKWQRILLLTSWSAAVVTLCIEISTFITLLTHGERADYSFKYIFLRIITPTILNFGFMLITTILRKSNKVSMNVKNNLAAFCMYMICSVLAIFHNYFQVFLAVPGFAFFVCVVFGEKRILRNIMIATIPTCIIAGTAFWLDPDSKDTIYRTLTLVCSNTFIFCAFFFAKAVMRSQVSQLSYIHETYKKQAELIEELKIEPLTKLYNRVAMDGTINRIIGRKKSESINPYLVMMDIDFFKRVNDKYGHTAGDEVLVTLAEIIKKNMGSLRRAFRYGGEEFVLIFEDSMPANVIYTVQSIRKDFADKRFSFAPNESFSLCAGISVLHPDFDAKHWINSADQCLYYAKNHGRNQIKTAEFNY